MERLGNSLYVSRQDNNYGSTYSSILSIYNENDPRIVLARKREYIPELKSTFTKYGIVMPFEVREIKIDYNYGEKLFEDEESVIGFMDTINRLCYPNEVEEYVGTLGDNKGNARVLKS